MVWWSLVASASSGHTSRTIIHVCGQEGWVSGWMDLSRLPLVVSERIGGKNGMKRPGWRKHASHFILLRGVSSPDSTARGISVSYPSCYQHTLSSVLGIWWNTIKTLPKCSLYLYWSRRMWDPGRRQSPAICSRPPYPLTALVTYKAAVRRIWRYSYLQSMNGDYPKPERLSQPCLICSNYLTVL